MIFREMLLSQFISVLLHVLIQRTHNLLRDEIGNALYNMAAVDFDGFYSQFLPNFLNVTENVDDCQNLLLLQIFRSEKVSFINYLFLLLFLSNCIVKSGWNAWNLRPKFIVGTRGPQMLSCEGCNPFSTRRPGWSRTQENSTTSQLCSGISFIGFPSANASFSKLQPSFETRSRPWPDISQSILHPHFENLGESPTSRSAGAGTPHHTSNQDTLLRAKNLPCLRTDRVELPARWHCKSRTDIGTFQDGIENLSILPSSAQSAYVTWLRGA